MPKRLSFQRGWRAGSPKKSGNQALPPHATLMWHLLCVLWACVSLASKMPSMCSSDPTVRPHSWAPKSPATTGKGHSGLSPIQDSWVLCGYLHSAWKAKPCKTQILCVIQHLLNYSVPFRLQKDQNLWQHELKARLYYIYTDLSCSQRSSILLVFALHHVIHLQPRSHAQQYAYPQHLNNMRRRQRQHAWAKRFNCHNFLKYTLAHLNINSCLPVSNAPKRWCCAVDPWNF